MSDRPWKLVTIDIDGTLTTVHGWRFLAQRRGREAEYEATTRSFFAHEITEDEHLRHLLTLAVGLEEREVDAMLEATPKLSGIREAVDELKGQGLKVALLTHNPDYVCRWYCERFGFDGFDGTARAEIVDRRVAPVGPVRADKLGGIRRLSVRWGVSPSSIVHVGDGWADAAVFAKVGAGISMNTHLEEVRRAADVVLEGDDLRPLVTAIDHLRPRPG